MLYKLSKTDDVFDGLEPVPFKTFAECGQVEKDLENLLAKYLLDELFEGSQLMPIFQERSLQAEADIYALNRNGGLVVFELKRAIAGDDAVHQALRYCETAAHWNYDKLQSMYLTWAKKQKTASDGKDLNLQDAHRVNFDLETALPKSTFNQQQHLMVVGSAASDDLVRNIDYWRSKGIAIDFVPYRIYQIGGEHYFEFFSPPYDSHSNPADKKGVLFDTCRSYNEECIWYMCENNRVAAFGDQKHVVAYLGIGDMVFLYQAWEGIVAAGKVKSGMKQDTSRDAMYRDVEWSTSLPSRDHRNPMSAARIKEVLGRNFFWARTIKSPYLSVTESEKLLAALKDHLVQP